MLRHRLVVGHADLVEEVEGGCVEEGLAQNVDVEVVDEDREDDPDQVMLMTTAKTMKLAKKMSMSKVEAKRCHQVGKDLVDEGCVEEVDRKMVMCRCGGVVMSLTMASREDLDGTRALLPCQMVPGFHLKGVPRWGCSEVVGLSCHCVHAWSSMLAVESVLMIATVVVVVLLPLMLAPFSWDASLSQAVRGVDNVR